MENFYLLCHSFPLQSVLNVFTHRRSIAEHSGWMFSAAFVCLFVSVFDRTITSDRLNLGRSNLAVRYIVQKSRQSSMVKGQGHHGQKKTKNCWVTPIDNAMTRSSAFAALANLGYTSDIVIIIIIIKACAVARLYAACSNRRYHCVPPGGDGLCRWAKSALAV